MSLPPPPPPGTPPPPPPGDWSSPSRWGGGYGGGGYGGASGPRAGFWLRFLGSFIDGLLLGVVNAVIESGTNRLTSTAVGLLVGLIYTTVLLGSPRGQTLGMRAVGIRMIDASTSGRVDYGRCVIRHLVAIVSGLVFALGYLWMLWDPERQTWHDKAADVYVVPVSAYPIQNWPG